MNCPTYTMALLELMMTCNELLLTYSTMCKNEMFCLPELRECPKTNLQTESLLNWGVGVQEERLCVLDASR